MPEFRNQGIGKTFVKILLEQFDICGVIGVNPGVKRNYQRAGFEFFKDNTLKRFILQELIQIEIVQIIFNPKNFEEIP